MSQVGILQHLSTYLTQAGLGPKKLQLANVGPFYHVSAFDKANAELITEAAACGFSRDRDLAVTKALVEWAERIVGREALENGIECCQTKRSDGLAAFPTQVSGFVEKARENALNEAIERYVWATWWDDDSVGYKTSKLSAFDDCTGRISELSKLSEELNCSEVQVVIPLHNASNKEVIILIAYSNDGGVLSGGACGEVTKTLETIDRAFAELYRHMLATEKYKKRPTEVTTFYERRLLFFGMGQGLKLVKARLSKNGSKEVKLPRLKFDQQVPSAIENLVYVHRCYFHNQPPFVDGPLDRFCL